jgi:transposase
LEYLRANTKDKKIYVRYTCVLMYDSGLTYDEISRYLGIGEKTSRRAVEAYRKGGIEELSRYNFVGNTSNLTEYQKHILIKELSANLYVSCKEVIDYIKNEFDIEYSESGVCKLLKRLGFVYKQTKLIPGKADMYKQSDMAGKLVELIENLDKDSKVFFMDGVHPTHNTGQCYGWILKGHEYEMSCNSGRQRININGAMNAQDPTETYVDYTDSVNAQSTIRLIENIIESNKDRKVIYLVSDNARYYKNTILQEYIGQHPNIKWIFLPPYSPNLNLIERMWRFMRKEVLNGYYYDTFDKFKKEIHQFFESLKYYESDLKNLITLNFQLFNHA